jgi:hypothetical protein
MGIAAGKAHVLGRNQKFFAAEESTAGTFKRPAATDAIKTQQSMMKHDIVDEPIDDNHDYRYAVETVQDKERNNWSWDGYLIPSGTAATEPDVGPMLTAALGADNSGGSSKWIWTVASTQVWPTLSLTRHFNAIWQECMWGSLVDKISFKLAGGSQPMVHAEGRAFGYALTGASTLNGAMAATDQMIVQTADQYKFSENSVVKIDGDDGLNDLGYKVSVDTSRPTFTIVNADDDSAASVSEDSTDPVVPHVPTPTFTGSPISGVSGAYTIDSTNVLPIQSVEITLENNHDLFEDEILSQRSTDFVPGMVKVTVVNTLRIRQDQTYLLANPAAFTAADLAFRAGPATAGLRFEFDVDYGRAIFPDIAIPKDNSGTATLTYSGLGSGANGPLIITHQ